MADGPTERALTLWKGHTFKLPLRLRTRLTPSLPFEWVNLTGSVLVFEATWSGQVGGPFTRRSDTSGWWVGNQSLGGEKGAATLTLTVAEVASFPVVGTEVRYRVRQISGADEFLRLFGLLLIKQWP